MEQAKAKKDAEAKRLKDEEDRLEQKLKKEREQIEEAYRKEEEAKKKKVQDARNANQQIMEGKMKAESKPKQEEEENSVVSKKPRGIAGPPDVAAPSDAPQAPPADPFMSAPLI